MPPVSSYLWPGHLHRVGATADDRTSLASNSASPATLQLPLDQVALVRIRPPRPLQARRHQAPPVSVISSQTSQFAAMKVLTKELAAVVQGLPRHGLLQIRRARAATDPFPASPATDSSGSGQSGELSKCRRCSVCGRRPPARVDQSLPPSRPRSPQAKAQSSGTCGPATSRSACSTNKPFGPR